MALLRKKDIKNMNTAELESRLKDLKLELLKANAQKAGKTATNVRIRVIKRTIARMLTELNKKQKQGSAQENKKQKTRKEKK